MKAKEKDKYPDLSLTGMVVRGFQSIKNRTKIDLRPLTILAGANSSGKSAIMKPLLLLKQTQEVGYDPGTLLVNGPILDFSEMKQLLWNSENEKADSFSIGLEKDDNYVELEFMPKRRIIVLSDYIFRHENRLYHLSEKMKVKKIKELVQRTEFPMADIKGSTEKFEIIRDRFKLKIVKTMHTRVKKKNYHIAKFIADPFGGFDETLSRLIYLPANRANPERIYRKSGVGKHYPGRFDVYVASVIDTWKNQGSSKLKTLGNQLGMLDLTHKITSQVIDDVNIGLEVGRTLVKTRTKDLVSIADVGFGVSQVLPVLVGMLASEKGQIVYVEQPEIHLHPRAQARLGNILVDAVKRGVNVIVETHSSILLKSIQTLVARNKVEPSFIKLHWFKRSKRGVTRVISGDMDRMGTFGNWPEDFGTIEMAVEKKFLDASFKVK